MYRNIEAILFDMGGTLKKPFKKTEDRRRLRMGVRSILSAVDAESTDDEDISRYTELLLKRYYNYRKWAADTLKELKEEEIWTRWMLPEFDKEVVQGRAIELNDIFKEMIGESTLREEAGLVVKELHRRGYRLGIVSNTFSSTGTPKLLKELQLDRYFDVVMLSSTHGLRKPHPGMITDALESLKVKPEHCAFVGDKVDRDMLAASKAGLALSVLILNPGKEVAENRSFEELPDIRPDFIIKDLRELLEIFL